MELLHRNARLLHNKLLFDTCTEDVRSVNFEQSFRFVLTDVVDDQGPLRHFWHHPVIVLEAESLSLKSFHVFCALSRAVPFGIGVYLKLLNVATVSVDLEER